MRIYAKAADQNACGYYRIYQPAKALSDYGGHRVHVNAIHASRDWEPWGLVSDVHHPELPATPADVAIIQRVVLPPLLARWQYMRAHFGSRLVMEMDDDVFAVDPTNPQKVYNKPEVLDTLRLACATADMVTVSTQPLADVIAKESGAEPVVIGNYVDEELFSYARPRAGRLTVGWTGGGSHLPDWEIIAPQLRRFLSRHPQVELHVLGVPFHEHFKIPGRHTPWQRIEVYLRSIDFDIGVAPLAPTRFNRSKSGLRALEYGALGIPVVATDCPPYADVIVDGKTGFLVRRDFEWSKRLHELACDEAMREEMGAAAREHVRAWSIERGWREWEAAFRRLCEGG